jgi:hypothetical protein
MTEWKNISARLLHVVIKPPPGRTITTTSPRSKSPSIDLRIGRRGKTRLPPPPPLWSRASTKKLQAIRDEEIRVLKLGLKELGLAKYEGIK